MLPRFFLIGAVQLAGLATLATTHAAEVSSGVAAERDPVHRWELDFESGVLWRVGGRATPLSYVVLPQILTVKTPAVMRRPWRGGDLVMRSRFSLLIEPIVKGPETRHIGASASGILEWWNPARTGALFFSSGGGLGGMDSKGYEVKGAQGQDLNFNWFLYAGARYRGRGQDKLSLAFGLFFQHISNTGLDKVNPGLEVLGPLLSVGWHF